MFESSDINATLSQAIKSGEAYLWNGPVCTVCGRGYTGFQWLHKCQPADLEARIAFLQAKLDEIRAGE